ncbi:MAG: hypothetical protein ACETWR_09005 [Anaerolineae bacterium]
MMPTTTTTIQTTLPTRLAEQQMDALIREGWFPNADVLIAEALRRFLNTHRAELMERFIREDVEWGLHGADRSHVRCRAASGAPGVPNTRANSWRPPEELIQTKKSPWVRGLWRQSSGREDDVAWPVSNPQMIEC